MRTKQLPFVSSFNPNAPQPGYGARQAPALSSRSTDISRSRRAHQSTSTEVDNVETGAISTRPIQNDATISGRVQSDHRFVKEFVFVLLLYIYLRNLFSWIVFLQQPWCSGCFDSSCCWCVHGPSKNSSNTNHCQHVCIWFWVWCTSSVTWWSRCVRISKCIKTTQTTYRSSRCSTVCQWHQHKQFYRLICVLIETVFGSSVLTNRSSNVRSSYLQTVSENLCVLFFLIKIKTLLNIWLFLYFCCCDWWKTLTDPTTLRNTTRGSSLQTIRRSNAGAGSNKNSVPSFLWNPGQHVFLSMYKTVYK